MLVELSGVLQSRGFGAIRVIRFTRISRVSRAHEVSVLNRGSEVVKDIRVLWMRTHQASVGPD